MKKVFAIILLMAVLTLSACHREMDELMGTWDAQIDVQQLLDQRIQQESPELAEYVAKGQVLIHVRLTFFADGTYQAHVDPESVEKACQDYAVTLGGGIWAYLKDLHGKSDSEQTLEEYLDGLGITREELLEEVIGDTLADELILALDIRQEGQFLIQKGKLSLSQSLSQEPDGECYHLCKVSEGELTLSPGEYPNSQEEAYFVRVLPKTFRRQ